MAVHQAAQTRKLSPVGLRWPPHRYYLGIAWGLSVCLHAAVVLWGQWHIPAPQVTSNLEVVLVNAQTHDTPVNPTVLAQQALDGGGRAQTGVAASPLPRTVAESPDAWVLAALHKRQAALEAQQQALLTRLLNQQHQVAPHQPDPALEQPEQTRGADRFEQEYQVVNDRIAALKARVEAYNAQPRRQFIGPAAAQVAYADYVEQWRHHIEQLGTAHYPDEARGRLYGSLQLTVHIRRDGSLARVDIDRPSEHAVLNLAAQRIVRLAAPFAPLPEAVARDTDVLAITRTWHYTDQHLETRP